MNPEDFNNIIKPLADKWADDMIKDGLVNEDGTIPMSEWANLSKHPITVDSKDLISINANQLHYISFHNKENKEIGKLNFDGDKLVFEGDVEESAKNFMDYLLMCFNEKIEDIKHKSYSEGYRDGESDTDFYHTGK